jgi:hypothetical protein
MSFLRTAAESSMATNEAATPTMNEGIGNAMKQNAKESKREAACVATDHKWVRLDPRKNIERRHDS